jgi:hypothetical protein
MNPPPLMPEVYTDYERALIAGYLLRMRHGTLQAKGSVGSPPAGSTEGWAEGNFLYYKDAERYSRFLLWWIGYPVGKDQMYVQP